MSLPLPPRDIAARRRAALRDRPGGRSGVAEAGEA